MADTHTYFADWYKVDEGQCDGAVYGIDMIIGYYDIKNSSAEEIWRDKYRVFFNHKQIEAVGGNFDGLYVYIPEDFMRENCERAVRKKNYQMVKKSGASHHSTEYKVVEMLRCTPLRDTYDFNEGDDQ